MRNARVEVHRIAGAEHVLVGGDVNTERSAHDVDEFDAGMLVKEFQPDLVVLDVMLPDINGREVCQRVRSDKNLDDVKIICISGMVEPEKASDLRAAGADDFMQKPFEVERLLERCCELLTLEASLA